MAYYLSQMSKDKAAARNASESSDRWIEVFILCARQALREMDNRTPLSPTIVDALDADVNIDAKYEFRLGEMVDYYLSINKEWAMEAPENLYAIKEKAVSKIRRLYYADNPVTGAKGGTR